jgi:hypothetical protein
MHTVGSFVETLAGFISRLRLAFHLHPDSAFDHVADHGTRMAMGSGRLPGSVSHFHDVGHQVAAIQRRQSMLESDSSLFAAADAHRA